VSGGGNGLDQRSRRVAESLLVGNPGNNARSLPTNARPSSECQIEIGIEEIRLYEHNPRRTKNAKFDDIKESIRAGGLRTPITVTQRPGEAHYIVEAGGNTRLLALRQLWAETKDLRFRRLQVLYRPWQSERHVLTAHLIENEQRGDMSFWDRATGIVALKERLEAEQGRVLAIRPLEDALHGLGLAVNTATLALYLYATDRLRVLGDAVPDLAGLDVKTLQPRLNALRRHAQAQASIDEDALYAEVFEPVFRAVAGSFTVAATVEACEVALAGRLGQPVDALRAAIVRRGERSTGTAPSAVGAGSRDASVRDEEPGDGSGSTASQGAPDPADSVEAFAQQVGLQGVLRRSDASGSGYRLMALPDPLRADPAQQRAWSALALVTDESALKDSGSSALGSSPELIRWLTDPEDPTAEAFLALLTRLRQSRCAAPANAGMEGP
jgi:ParB family protein of integrating conjugative element (PFGI_1 class)